MSKTRYSPGRRRSDHGQSIRVHMSETEWDIGDDDYIVFFDRHALAMALQLAKLLERDTYVSCIDGRTPNGDRFYNGEREPGKRRVADWLRDEVEKELGSQ